MGQTAHRADLCLPLVSWPLDETSETRSPHRRYFGDLLLLISWRIFLRKSAGGITLAARATLDGLHMMDSYVDFKNYFGQWKKFLLIFIKDLRRAEVWLMQWNTTRLFEGPVEHQV